ncbi:TetR/AcrR family transcriptional regulator C-terminal domain-containing protein [Nonomuraea sp. NPDC050153]|uniref:TetR/AcrR family transcriptional regulator C-terminal domain-containing protein n=1 Tax=Nonomuraea sp. NPDC050153 TaxID=3364359 RepID=UPI0037B1303B
MLTCVQCGKELTAPSRGRRPLYCSRSCQARAYRARLESRTGQETWREKKSDRPPAPPPARPAPSGRVTREDPHRTDAGLSRERIVWTAIRIANADGLESMSMRHVANVLGVKVMSLYNYIDGKDELIDLMVEAVFSEGGDSEPRGPRGWRAELEAAARWEWALYSTYPWVLEVIATVQPPLVPSLLARFERGLGAFDGLGLDPVTTHRIYLGVSGIAQGLALLRVSEIASERRGGGISLSQWRSVKVPAVLEELGTDRYPRQAALRNSPEVIADLEEIFEFSLQRLLDGIARFLEGETGRSPSPPRLWPRSGPPLTEDH